MVNGPESRHPYTRKPRWYYKLRYLPLHIRRWALEDQAMDGLGGPPNDWRSINVLVYREIREDPLARPGRARLHSHNVYARFNNDAHEIWIGETYQEGEHVDDRWKWHCSTKTFKKLALWYLWRWAWGDWFGLRRKLFYWFLHRDVVKMQQKAR